MEPLPPPPSLPCEEIDRRVKTVQARAAADGLSAILAYADCWRTANVCYFSGYRAADGVHDIAMALMLIPSDGDPLLFVGDGCLEYAQTTSPFRAQTFKALESELSQHAKSAGQAPVGLAGSRLIPNFLHDRCTTALGAVPLTPTMIVAEEKACKSAWELEQMRAATRLTDYAMEAARDALAETGPMSERDLARAADAAMIEAGADGIGFNSMVQFGDRSAFSLAVPTNRVLQPGELVMTDIGARYGNYVADGGRGFAYGQITQQQRDIIEVAAEAVEVGLAAARPGITADSLNSTIQDVLVERGYGDYSSEAKGRGTGHGTGMDPEEELPWIGPGNSAVLAPGMVFTVKTTIGVPGVGGLRNEHIVHLTPTGSEKLDEFPLRNYW